MQTLEKLPFVGGHPALDFVNTAEERGHPLCGDVLRTPEDLRAWGRRYGTLTDTATCQQPARELARAIQARELLYRLCFSRVHGGKDDPDDLRQLATLHTQALAAAGLKSDPGDRLRWCWEDTELATVRHIAVASAVDLLTGAQLSRLKQCPGDHCGWFFLDATKRGNRRWCQMSDCGQIAKSAGRRRRASQASTHP